MYVFKQVCYEYKNGIPSEDFEFLSKLLYRASQDDIADDNKLLGKYVNIISSNIDKAPIESEETIAKIKNELVKYRTKTYKIKHVKAYEVFINKSADIISKYAPTTLEELKELKCLDEAQIEMYGNDIVDVVNSVIN